MLDNKTLQNLLTYNRHFYESTKISTTENYIASPLGAWLLLALFAGGNSKALDAKSLLTIEKYLSPVTGRSLESSFRLAKSLFASAPKDIQTAVDAWISAEHYEAAEAVREWAKNQINAPLIHLPSQDEVDDWADKNSLGIIKKFPLQINDAIKLILANVLATKIKWVDAFTTIPLTRLTDEQQKAFASFGNVEKVLYSKYDAKHDKSFFLDTRDNEVFAVISNSSENGLYVSSIMPLNSSLAPAHVIAVAEEWFVTTNNFKTLSAVELKTHLDTHHLSTPLLMVSDSQGHKDTITVTLPAWDAESTHELSDFMPFGSASPAVGGSDEDIILAVQNAKASYKKDGFEAAAVSVVSLMRGSLPKALPHCYNVSVLFANPYAVVAGIEGHRDSDWNNLPVFTAWVNKASEVE